MTYEYKGYKPGNTKHVYNYTRKHYHTMTVNFDKEFYSDTLKPLCDSLGIPVATFIKQAVSNEVERLSADKK